MRSYKLTCLVLLIFGSGCIRYPVQQTPSHSYYLNPAKNINKTGRVALIDLNNSSPVHQISENVTETLYQEIQKKQIFGLNRIRQDDPAWRALELVPDSYYSLEQVALMRQTLKCDAVLTGTITVYEPYPHMSLGLRLRLVDLSDGQLLWAIEQIWDTTDKSTGRELKPIIPLKELC